MFYFYIIASTSLFLYGDYLAKLWVKNNNWGLLAIILSFYLGGCAIFLFALRKIDSLSFITLLSTLSGLIGGVLIGHFLFGERLNHFQYFGLTLAVIAIFFITFPFQVLSK